MSFHRFAVILIALILIMETGLAVWDHLSLKPSKAPFFSWPEAAAHFGKSSNLERTVELYRCDRASELKTTLSDGTDLASVYLEWDRIEAGPAMGFASHGAEMCNTGLGYKFLGVDAERAHHGEGSVPVVFDCTRFLDPTGRPVFMYKTAWVQGSGSWQLRDEGEHRIDRFTRSFRRTTGAGRVLLTAVYGLTDPEQAWTVFNREVLAHLVWTTPSA